MPERSKTVERGYGSRHKQLRRAWARQIEAGYVNCARCGLPIEPGTPWDLGHSDIDRSEYTGPEHAAATGRQRQGRSAATRGFGDCPVRVAGRFPRLVAWVIEFGDAAEKGSVPEAELDALEALLRSR